MATNNKYKYFGNYFLSLRGVFGKLLSSTQIIYLQKISAIIKHRRWRAYVKNGKWRAYVKKV